MVVLDTNVVSELMLDAPSPAVLRPVAPPGVPFHTPTVRSQPSHDRAAWLWRRATFGIFPERALK